LWITCDIRCRSRWGHRPNVLRISLLKQGRRRTKTADSIVLDMGSTLGTGIGGGVVTPCPGTGASLSISSGRSGTPEPAIPRTHDGNGSHTRSLQSWADAPNHLEPALARRASSQAGRPPRQITRLTYDDTLRSFHAALHQVGLDLAHLVHACWACWCRGGPGSNCCPMSARRDRLPDPNLTMSIERRTTHRSAHTRLLTAQVKPD
jgi:hypothetical protein